MTRLLVLLALCALPGAAMAAPQGSAVCQEVVLRVQSVAGTTNCHAPRLAANLAAYEDGGMLRLESPAGVVCVQGGLATAAVSPTKAVAFHLNTLRSWTCHKKVP